MGVGTSVSAGDAILAAKMNLKLEDVDTADLGTITSITLASGTNPAGSSAFIGDDSSGDITINALTAKAIHLAVNGTDEYDFDASKLAIGANNDIQFGGNDGILDSSGNEVVLFEAVGSAVNYLNIKNAATANPIVLECQGTADRGFIFANDQDEEILILTPQASGDTELTILNAAAGQPIIRVTGTADTGLEIQNAAGEIELETLSSNAPLNWIAVGNANTTARPYLLNPGEDDVGIEFRAKNNEEMLILAASAGAVNELTITSAATGAEPSITASGDDTDIGITLITKGAGSILIDQNGEASALVIDSEQTTTNIVVLHVNTLTAGTALYINGADALTSGTLAELESDSADTTARTLLKVINNNSAAVGAIPIGIQQDAANEALFVDQNANGQSIYIDTEGTTANILDIDGNTLTTGHVLDCDDADALTDGGFLDLVSNSSNTSARNLVFVHNDNSAAVGAVPLALRQDAANEALFIDQDGNQSAVYIDTQQTTTNVLDVEADTLTTGVVLLVDNANALTSGGILSLLSDSADNTTRTLVKVTNDNTGATGTTLLELDQDAAQRVMLINQDAAGVAIEIDTEGAAVDVIDINAPATTTGTVFQCEDANAITTGQMADWRTVLAGSSLTARTADYVQIALSREEQRTSGATSDDYDAVSLTRTSIANGGGGTLNAAGSVLRLLNVATQTAGTLADTVAVLEVVQDADSTGNGILLDVNGNSVALNIDTEGTTADIIDIPAPTLTTGAVIRCDDANALTSGQFADLVSTVAASSLANRTAAYLELAASREEQRTSGTTADDYDLVSFLRTNIANGAGGTLTTTGSVLRVANVATQTAGTLTDTTAGIEVSLDALSTGNALFINVDDTGSGRAIYIDSEVTTATNGLIDVEADTLTTGLVLNVDNANALTTGGILNLVSNSADVTARNLVYVVNDNSAAVGAIVLSLKQDAANEVVFINQDADGQSILIDAESTTANVIDIDAETTSGIILEIDANTLTEGKAIDLSDADALTTGTLVDLQSNSADTGAFKVLNIVNNNAAAVGAIPLAIQQDSSQFAITLSGAGGQGVDLNGMSVDLDADGDTSITADTDDTIDIEVSGADDFRFVANSLELRTGSDINVETATNEHVVFCSRNTVAYTDTTNKTLFMLPANAVVIDWWLVVTTLFNGSGTDLMNIGTTSGDPDEYVDAADVSSAGLFRAGSGATYPYGSTGSIGASPLNVYAKYVDQNSDATAGAATFYLTWTVA